MMIGKWYSTGRKYGRIKAEVKSSGKSWRRGDRCSSIVTLLLLLLSGAHN